jgi:hypothetical protein
MVLFIILAFERARRVLLLPLVSLISTIFCASLCMSLWFYICGFWSLKMLIFCAAVVNPFSNPFLYNNVYTSDPSLPPI